jgi:hypothetical protein
LIAAAPELLEALKGALNAVQIRYAESGSVATREAYERVLSAIAKAEGRT